MTPPLLRAPNTNLNQGANNPFSLSFTSYGKDYSNPYSLSSTQPTLWDSPVLNFDTGAAPTSTFMSDWFGKDGKAGYANTAMNLIGGGVGMYTGIKALGMAEDQFKFNMENILRDRAIKEGMLARTVALQDQNRAAARGYPSTNQNIPSIPNIPSISEQMKRYGA